MRKLNFKLMRETIEWPHRKKGTRSLVLPKNTPAESYRFFKTFGAECERAECGVGDYDEDRGTYAIPIHAHGKNLMGGEEFMEVHSALKISKSDGAVVSGFYTTTPMPEYNGTVIIGPPLINFKKDTQYTLALQLRYYSSATTRNIAMRFDYSDGTFEVPIINSSSRDFKLCFTSAKNKHLVAISSYAENALNIRYGIDGFGLFEGAYDDYEAVFEAYSGYKRRISVNEPLRKIGFSADELDLFYGEITRKIKSLTIDGSSEINETENAGIFAISLSVPARPGRRINSPLGEISETEANGLSLSSDATEILLKIGDITSADDLKTYLSENPITVAYVLREYTHETTDALNPEAVGIDLTMDIMTERAPSRTVAEYV